MHKIQKHILKKLLFNQQLSYAKIKPREVEGNLFTYHLGKLIKDGVVGKYLGKYSLTSKGKRYAARISLKTMRLRVQPKIVTEIVCKNSKVEFVLYKQKRQPFIGEIGFPYGKIHLGEKIAEAAAREFKEKTGLSALLTHRGEIYSSVYEKSELVSHMLIHVFTCSKPKGKLIEANDDGEYFWGDPSTFAQDDKLMPATKEILKLLNKNSTRLFFDEIITKKK